MGKTWEGIIRSSELNLPPSCCVTMNESPNLSGPHCPHELNEGLERGGLRTQAASLGPGRVKEWLDGQGQHGLWAGHRPHHERQALLQAAGEGERGGTGFSSL